MSSTKKLPTSAVTAGIRKIDPTMIPRPAATEITQARIDSGAWALAPNMLSAQFAPPVASQTSSRCSPIPMTTIRASASPEDFNSTARNGGENI